MGLLSQAWNSIKNFGSANSGGLISATINAIGAARQRNFEMQQAAEERAWSEEMQHRQNEWNLEQWNRTNEYNSPSAQRQRLEDAGLNPLYYGLDGSSANGLESAQPLGYDRASMAGIDNPLAAAVNAFQQNRQLESQIDLQRAQAANLRSQTSGTELDNEFKKRTLDARIEGQELANSMTKEQLSKVKEETKQISANINKIIAETDNEYEKKTLIMAERNLRNMEAKQIVEMLPYQQLLASAQTENQKASASLAFVQAAIQNGLLDRGYVDLQFELLDQQARKAGYDADNAENVAAISRFKSAIRNGNWSEDVVGRSDNFVSRFFGNWIDATYSAISAVAESVAGPISGFVK